MSLVELDPAFGAHLYKSALCSCLWIEAALFYELFMFQKLKLESVSESECSQC